MSGHDGSEALEPLLQEALAVSCEVAGVRRGYIALGSDGGAGERPRWWIACGLSEKDVANEERKGIVTSGVIAEARLVHEALEETGWNILETAERLDIARSHVYDLIKAHGLKRKG